MAVRNVFFDLDGTLVDSLPGIEYSVDQALAACGFTRTVDLRPLIGPPIRRILATVAPPDISKQKIDELEAAFRSSYDSEGWKRTALYDHARETLELLAGRDIALFVVTNKPGGPARRILEHFKVFTLFNKVLCKDHAAPAFASKAEMLSHLMLSRGAVAGNCILVGDTQEDGKAASETGVRFILVRHGYGEFGMEWPVYAHISHLSEITCLL